MFNKIKLFFQESRQEVKRINWPTRQETIKLTLMVIFLSIFVSVLLGAFDFIFSYVLKTYIIK